MPVFYTLLYQISGDNASFFHFFQLTLHIFNAVLVFLIFCYFFNEFLAFFLALIFLVHPINVETVVYSASLQEVLFMIFGLLAFYLYLKNNRLRIFLIMIFLLLSMLSKETGGLFLILTAFYGLLKKRYNFNLFVTILVPFLIYLFLRFGIAQIGLIKNNLAPIARANFFERLITMPKIIFFYLKTIFFPKTLLISQHWMVKTINFSDFYLPLLLIFLMLIFWLFLSFFVIKKDRLIWWFFSFWFFITLGFHLQFFPLDLTVSDRWAYLMLVGFLGMIGLLVNNLKIKTEKLRVIFIVVIILFSLRTIIRIFNWRDGLTLYKHDIKYQTSFDLENNYGVELFRSGKRKEAKKHFENSIKLAPYWWTNWNNLGVIYELKGDLKRAKKMYLRSIENGHYYLAYENYVKILIKEENYKDCLDFLEKKALLVFPENEFLNRVYFYCQEKLKT